MLFAPRCGLGPAGLHNAEAPPELGQAAQVPKLPTRRRLGRLEQLEQRNATLDRLHAPRSVAAATLASRCVRTPPVMRLSAGAVSSIVKTYARLAGLDPTEFAGHSLRAGFVTSAAERGKSSERIMDHTGHRSVAMVRVYTRRSDAFVDHAGEGLL